MNLLQRFFLLPLFVLNCKFIVDLVGDLVVCLEFQKSLQDFGSLRFRQVSDDLPGLEAIACGLQQYAGQVTLIACFNLLLFFVDFRWDLVSSCNFEILAAQSNVVLEAKVDVNLFGL